MPSNNFESNVTEKTVKSFLKGFESSRILSKNVNTQLLEGEFDPDSGDTVNFKRPHDYRTVRTSDGDVSAETRSPIVSGKASGVVQDYFTAFIKFSEADQAIKMGNMDQITAPLARRMVTDLEVDFASFMMKNCGLYSGTKGQAINSWQEIANVGALMKSMGISADSDWMLAVNPYTQAALSEIQRSLGAGGAAGNLISEAHRKAILASDFGGMKVITATALASYTTGAGADRVGTLSSAPDATYLTAKDTMRQTLAVTGMDAALPIKAGDIVVVTGRNRLNLSTRKAILTASGANVLWSGVVYQDVTLSGGAGNVVVSGPAIYEADGAYNTVDAALASGDVVTILGAASTSYQPNLFWHKDAFGIGSVPMERLSATDSFMETEDGIMIRVTRSSAVLENKNEMRVDIRPAYAALNPFLAGHAFGDA